MPATRTPEEIRRDIERNRKELAGSLVVLRNEVTELTDWRRHLRDNQQNAMIAAAVTGFVIGGGIAGVVGVLSPGKRRRRKRGW